MLETPLPQLILIFSASVVLYYSVGYMFKRKYFTENNIVCCICVPMARRWMPSRDSMTSYS